MEGARLGRYELLRRLGAGGMGVVYEARDAELDRTVAVKVLDASQAGVTPEFVERFRREAQAAARLRHPHIVPVHDVGVAGPVHYFAMDLIAGQTAQEALAAGPMTVPRAAAIVRDAARAVHYAHEGGVLHRDLKPGNILLAADGRPMVMDFGLARRVGDDVTRLTVPGEIFGTPGFMSPEQASGAGEVDARTDVWSLGATLYALLVGDAPFPGTNVFLILDAVHSRDPESPRRKNPQVPREIDAIVMKCLEKEPARRYPTAAALAEDLENWLHGRPVQARPTGPVSRAFRKAKRNPLLTVLAVLAALAFLTAGGFVGKRYLDARSERIQAREALAAGRPADAIRHYEAAQAIWSAEDRDLDRRIEEARRGLREEEWKRALGAAYLDLVDAAGALFERAAAASGTPEALAAEFDALVAEWRADHREDYRFVHALRGWLLFLAGDEAGGGEEVESACGPTEREPFGWMYRGRIRFVQILRTVGTNTMVVDPNGAVSPTTPLLPPAIAGVLAQVAEDMDRVAESAVFGQLRRRRELEAQVEGFRALAESRYVDAEAAFEIMSRTTGMQRDGLRALGLVAFFRGDWDRAVDLWRQVVALPGAKIFDLYHYGDALVAAGMAAEHAGGNGGERLARAAEFFEGYSADHPEDAMMHDRAGLVRYSLAASRASHGGDPEPDFRAAIAQYDEAVRLAPDVPGYLSNRGLCDLGLAQCEAGRRADPRATIARAVADLGEALRLDPGLPFVHWNLGRAYAMLGSYEVDCGRDPTPAYREGIAVLEDLARRDDRSVFARQMRGSFLVGLAAWKAGHGEDPRAECGGAAAAFREALGIQPDDDDALFGLGEANLLLGEWLLLGGGGEGREALVEAAEWYGRVIDRHPDHLEARFKRGTALFKVGMIVREGGGDPSEWWGRALEDFTEADRATPPMPHASFYRGQILEAGGRLEEARAAYETELQRDPADRFSRESLDRVVQRLQREEY